MTFDLRLFNQEQKRAIVYDKGPLLIVAGPGTGKTAVIVSRITYLIQRKKISPEQILALTFTDKAVNEIQDRVDDSNYYDSWISTFHSFGDRILRENGLSVGLSTDFKILEEVNAWLLIKRNLDRFKLDYYQPLGNPNKFIKALIEHFGRLKDETITPEKYLEFSKKQKEKRIKELAQAYRVYQDILLENNFLDFGDLINYSLEIFKKRPLILERYRKKFKSFLIDEFQDTNYAQYQLMKSLKIKNLTVCADINQSIYQWRGASSSNIDRFIKDYPQAQEIFLVRNYRSLQNILDLSDQFIKNDSPKLIAQRKGKGEIKHLDFKTPENEFYGIIEEIVDKVKNKKAVFGDFAILSRTNNEANLMARSCQQTGIPYRFFALKGLYQKPVVLDIISYFKLLDNYHENSAVYRLLNFPFLGIKSQEISSVTLFSYQKIKSIYDVLKNISQVPNVSLSSRKKINQIVDLIEKHSLLASRKSVSQVFVSFLKDTGYLEYLAKEKKESDIGYINEFYTRIKKFEGRSPDPLLKNFMEEFNLELESGESGRIENQSENQSDSVSIMTVHSAKGLEFRYVFIINLIDRKFPTIDRKNSIEMPEKLEKSKNLSHIEEERKLFYVAMTRAKDGLYFTSAGNNKRLSRFLIELGYNSGLNIENKPLVYQEKELPRKQISNFKHFSFTQLMAFSNCPLQYKYAHILKIPLQEKSVFVFGKSIHNTLNSYLKACSLGKVSFSEFEKIYDSHWIDEWYQNKKQRDQYRQLGRRIIKSFFSDFNSQKTKIALINKELALEVNFSLKINNYTIKGKIDRIDQVEGGFEIIDYKTGNVKKKLEKKDKDQLLIYQIALKEIFQLNPVKLTYHYLNENKKLSFVATQEDEDKIKEKIVSQIKKIEKSSFQASPGWHCQHCDFRSICGEKAF
jgi:DNA helicase II / ATP-dependent DNA helicase PcrA